MTRDAQPRREQILVALLLAASGLLALGLAAEHVTLRDAWRAHDLALTHWQTTDGDLP